MDFSSDEYFSQYGPAVPMRRLPTGHRAISIVDFDPDGWSLPDELRKGPAVDPFLITSSANYAQSSDTAILVWLATPSGLEYIHTLHGPRSTLVLPQECPPLQERAISTTRTTHMTSLDDPAQVPLVLHDLGPTKCST